MYLDTMILETWYASEMCNEVSRIFQVNSVNITLSARDYMSLFSVFLCCMIMPLNVKRKRKLAISGDNQGIPADCNQPISTFFIYHCLFMLK